MTKNCLEYFSNTLISKTALIKIHSSSNTKDFCQNTDKKLNTEGILLEQYISQTSTETKCNSFVYLFAHFCPALFEVKKNPSYLK